MKNNWEIVDDNGTIYSGTEDEMHDIFSEIVYKDNEDPDGHEFKWTGDLRLIQVWAIHI